MTVWSLRQHEIQECKGIAEVLASDSEHLKQLDAELFNKRMLMYPRRDPRQAETLEFSAHGRGAPPEGGRWTRP